MNPLDHLVTIDWWEADGTLVEVTLPGSDALQIAAGRAVASHSWEIRSFRGDEALERVEENIAGRKDRIAAVNAHLDQLKAEYVELADEDES